MANTLITPDVIASRALPTLYNSAVLLPLVYRDYESEFAGKQGDTITVKRPATFTPQEFNRVAGISIQDIVESTFTVTLNKIVDVSVEITAEQLTLDLISFDQQVLAPAMESFAQYIDGVIAEELVDASSLSGGGGAVSGTGVSGHTAGELQNVLIEGRQVLSRNKLPFGERYVVLSPESAGGLISLDLMSRADARGDTLGLVEAAVGRKFGFDTYESQVFGYGYGDKGQADGVAFHKTALAFVSRSLAIPKGKGPDTAAVQNYKGLSLRVVSDYDITHKKDVVSIDLLFGLKTIRREAAVELNFALGS